MIQSIDPTGLGAITSGSTLQTLRDNQNTVLADLARSGFQGLLSSLSATGAAQQTFNALSDSFAAVQQATALAAANPFVSASQSLQTSTTNSVQQGLVGQQNAEFGLLAQTLAEAQQAQAGTTSKTPESAAVDQVVAANQELATIEQQIKSGNLGSVVPDTQKAIADAQAALQAAQAALAQAPQSEQAAAAVVVQAAQDTVTAANKLLPVSQTAPIAGGQATPQIYDLGNGYSATVWGNTGYWSLVDPGGHGILVGPDGSVSNLDGSNQWKFDTTSTFVLPDDTKITVIPGSPTNVEFVRGKHCLEFNGLANGAAPQVVGPSENGRTVDQAQNDGYIFSLGADAGQWTLNGFNIANGSEVATQPLTNELKLDPTAISISPQLASYLTSQGITLQSYAGNGKYNDSELQVAVTAVAQNAALLSSSFNTILQASALANSTMHDLTVFLQQLQVKEGLRDQQRVQNQLQNQANERDQVAAIRQRLDSAQRLLNANASTLQPLTNPPPAANPVTLNSPISPIANPPAATSVPQLSSSTSVPPLATNIPQNRATRLLGTVPLQILETVTNALNQPTGSTPAGSTPVNTGPGGGPEVTVSQVNPFTVGGQTVVNPSTSPASNENLTSKVIGPEGNVISVPNLPANIPSTSAGFESASQPLGETKPSVTVSQVNPFTVGGETVVNPSTSPASNQNLTSQVLAPGGNVISVPNLPGNIPSISAGFESASQLPGGSEPNVPPLIPANPNAVGQLTPTTSQPNVPFPVSTSPVVGTVLHADRIFTPDTETPDTLPSPHNLVRGKTDPSPLANLQMQSANTSNAELTALTRQVQGLLQTQSDQMAQATAIFTSARDNVRAFLQVLDKNEALSKSIQAADVSKQDQATFVNTMADLRQRLGLVASSYTSASQDPTQLDSADKSQLLNKLMNAGLTI